jgi:predicted HicB family RNase H-like nuclease
MIPEKIMFSITNHALVTKAANAAGKSINDYVHDHVISERA